MPTDRGVKLLADIIVLNEITELLNSVNGSLSTSVANVKSVVDTINTNVNTVKTATAVNNTASTTGTLSQKMSSAIANTATNNTASKTGILSQKLAYVISLLENSTYGLNALKNAVSIKTFSTKTITKDNASSSSITLTTAQLIGLKGIAAEGSLVFNGMTYTVDSVILWSGYPDEYFYITGKNGTYTSGAGVMIISPYSSNYGGSGDPRVLNFSYGGSGSPTSFSIVFTVYYQ